MADPVTSAATLDGWPGGLWCVTGGFAETASMALKRRGQGATLLDDGTVLLDATPPPDSYGGPHSSEIFDPGGSGRPASWSLRALWKPRSGAGSGGAERDGDRHHRCGILDGVAERSGEPSTSSLNWAAGQTVPNSVTVKVGHAGKVLVFNQTGAGQVIVDVRRLLRR